MKRLVVLATLALAASASAEQSKFNLHLEPALGGGLNQPMFVAGGWLKLDTTLFHLGPIALNLGSFLSQLLNFLIIALVVFIVVKKVLKMEKK